MQHSDREQAVRQHRGTDMRLESKQAGIFKLVLIRQKLGQ